MRKQLVVGLTLLILLLVMAMLLRDSAATVQTLKVGGRGGGRGGGNLVGGSAGGGTGSARYRNGGGDGAQSRMGRALVEAMILGLSSWLLLSDR
ncbi:hypothetical protein O6H91_09G045700 [Diphasiastrum complanatum]|uniref:Uncharacterized protein n=1 Tax=Diphasiastrum complanatum TaxID=34168 RepID=A0ACC2CNW5_DIPCM|nr:hypothetical protein O6H91_09G045700 [Diphasiastrum complanatum]